MVCVMVLEVFILIEEKVFMGMSKFFLTTLTFNKEVC